MLLTLLATIAVSVLAQDPAAVAAVAPLNPSFTADCSVCCHTDRHFETAALAGGLTDVKCHASHDLTESESGLCHKFFTPDFLSDDACTQKCVNKNGLCILGSAAPAPVVAPAFAARAAAVEMRKSLRNE